MKINKLIKLLKKIEKKHGNLEICSSDERLGDFWFCNFKFSIDKVKKWQHWFSGIKPKKKFVHL